jgi:hypothetical protein
MVLVKREVLAVIEIRSFPGSHRRRATHLELVPAVRRSLMQGRQIDESSMLVVAPASDDAHARCSPAAPTQDPAFILN